MKVAISSSVSALLILVWFDFIQSSGTGRRRGEVKAEDADNSSSAASWA